MRKLNGQERFYRALKCEEVDKMPSFWMDITPHGTFEQVWRDFLNKENNPELDECFEIHPVLGDITRTNWYSKGTSSIISLPSAHFPYPSVYYNKEEDRIYTKKETQDLKTKEKLFRVSPYGSIREYEPNGTKGWYYGPYFRGPNAIERMNEMYAEFGAPWEKEMIGDLKRTKKLISKVKEAGFSHAVHGSAKGHFEPIWGGFGPLTIAKLMRNRPGFFKDLLNKFGILCRESAKFSAEAGFQIIKTGDDLGQKDRSLISPEDYRNFFYPHLKSRCDAAHKYGAVVFMHSCGFMEDLIPHFLDAGLDGLQSLEVPAGNDLARIRKIVGNKMCLVGGIDSSRVMTFGSPEQCEEHVKTQINKATLLDGERIDGGYIPGPAHNLIDTPMENVRTVIDAIAKYGKYPLVF